MKTHTMILGFLVISAIGCQEREYELWIDSSCTPEDQTVIREAVAATNRWTRENIGEALIEIVGTDKVDHEWAISEGADPNIGRNFVVCFYDDPEPEYSDNYEGLVEYGHHNGDVWLFMEHISNENQLLLFTQHGIGHYIGLGHPDGTEPAIMNSPPNSETYTDADLEELCVAYDCK